MTTRHWQISILKDGEPISLFVTTTAEMVDLDLNGDPEKSLIRIARQYHRHGQDEEQNHRDLAIGAIMAYAVSPPYDLADTHVEQCKVVHREAPSRYVGGYRRDTLVPIWEAPSEPETYG